MTPFHSSPQRAAHADLLQKRADLKNALRSLGGVKPALVKAPKPKGSLLGRALDAGGKVNEARTVLSMGPAGIGQALAGRALKNIGQATVEAPGRTLKNTAKGAKDSLVGIPAGLVSAATDPAGTLKQTAKDYSRRYGPLVSGNDKAFRERIKREGFASEALDAAGITAAGGATIGRGLGAAARAERVGSTVGRRAKNKRVMTEPRRPLRTSGGKAVPQVLSESLPKARRQKALDEVRRRKIVNAVEGKPIRVGKRRGERRPARPVPAEVREAYDRGEVVSLRARKRASAQRRGYARTKGRTLQQQRREQKVEVGAAKKNIAGLTRDEREAFKPALQLGATTPAAARRVVAARIAQIERQRASGDVELLGTDELPTLRRVLANTDRAITPQLAAVVRAERARTSRVATGDPGVSRDQARLRSVAPQAETLGLSRRPDEPAEAFIRRVVAARANGPAALEAPGYFPSRKRETVRYSAFAAGGAKAVKADKRYTGQLFREGREDASDTTYLQGVAQNVKRKHNWNLVADTVDKNTFGWSRRPDGRGKTIGELEDEMERKGIDPDSVSFWNPERYRQARQQWDQSDGANEERMGGEEPVAAGVSEAVRAASVDRAGLSVRPEDFRGTDGWVAIPKALHDEIHADTKPSGVFGRSLDVVKGKQARIMLGLSPAWLQYQVVANGLLAGLSGTGPLDLLKANLSWWRKLDEDQKNAIEPYVGVGAFNDAAEMTRLGASTNNAMVNAYRAMKAHDFWHKPRKSMRGASIRDVNPLDVLFRIDNAQNNFFRRGVLYSQVKRDAYKRMGGRMRAIQQDQDRLMDMLTLGPKEAMDAVIRDVPALERHAQHVNDFLGDYLTYTAKERRLLGRNVMFYGFLRFSLRFTFYTMPTKHPVMSAIVAQLGRMQVEEARRLLGGDELPFALGKFYFTQDGKFKSIDMSRANPAMNSITGMRGPSSLTGFLPPMFGALANQAYSKSAFRDRGFLVRGENQPKDKEGDYGIEDRARIFAEEMLSLAAPYRSVKKATGPVAEGDDSSLLFGRRPTKYKDPDTVANMQKQEARRPKSLAGRLREEFLPVVPRRDYSPEIAASIRQREAEKRGESGNGSSKPRNREELLLQREAERLAKSQTSSREEMLLQREAERIAAGR